MYPLSEQRPEKKPGADRDKSVVVENFSWKKSMYHHVVGGRSEIIFNRTNLYLQLIDFVMRYHILQFLGDSWPRKTRSTEKQCCQSKK